jgi:NAD(P)H dehydrogenase (quinone)
MPAKIAIIYYSSTGHVHQMAAALADGAEEAGAEVRLRRVAELASEEVIRSQDAWYEHYLATRDTVPEATLDDLQWADGYAFGTPTRYGNPTAQLKHFLDTTGPLWASGVLADKPVTSFTSSQHAHGGQESTILALNNVFYHWGCLIVAPGYTDPTLFEAGGNPYGTSYASQGEVRDVDTKVLGAVRYQGERLARFAERLAAVPAAA